MDKLKIKKEVTKKRFRGIYCQISDLVLYIDEELFNSDLVTGHKKKIQRNIHQRYWNTVNKYFTHGKTMLIKLSGLHFNIYDLKDYIVDKDSRSNMILHYHSWIIDDQKTRDEDTFALIECNRHLFKKLFDNFWFALGYELRFEAFILKPGNVFGIKNWSRQTLSKINKDLFKMSNVMIDNCNNGFHYRIIEPVAQSGSSLALSPSAELPTGRLGQSST